MSRLLDSMNAEAVRPLWPSLVEVPVPVDKPVDGNYPADVEYIYWAN
jgi:hypothetical protein